MFHEKYKNLMLRMEEQASLDGAIFLPNLEPRDVVKNIFICMEPSSGRWAKSIEDGRREVGAGFRNFTSSIEDMILHFCVSKYLCKNKPSYHFTDISKGAMTVKDAMRNREKRYDKWMPLLIEELKLIAAPNARFFAVGKSVSDYLNKCNLTHHFSYPFKHIIHYSPLNGRARKKGIEGQEDKFKEFLGSVNLNQIAERTDELFTSNPIIHKYREATLKRIQSSKLTESRQKLIYIYKRSFELGMAQ
jgi:hypothetical protein